MKKINNNKKRLGTTSLIRIVTACNEKCLFCNIPMEDYPNQHEKSFKDIRKELDELKKKNISGISLSGGEPTIHSKLFDIIRYLKKNVTVPLEIQTNALKFSDSEFTKKIKSAGVDGIFVSLHSHEKSIHDLLTGVNGSWEKCVGGMRNAIDEEIKVTINIVLNEMSFRKFPEFIEFLHKEFPKIKFVSVSVVQPNGRAWKNNHLLPKYSEMSPYIKRGANLADKFGILLNNPYCGLPLCFGFWYQRLEDNVEYMEGVSRLNKSEIEMVSKDKVKLADCSRCSLNNHCNGVWKKYLEVYPDLTVDPIMDNKNKIEDHSRERRHWVRLNRACNNRCIFCLDKEMFDGTMLSVNEIKKDLLRGRKLGIVRVVLSGGEATIHPEFLNIVKMAKKLGYAHVQVITNGRMFSYSSFLRQAVAAGLDEVTFSLHGHSPKIHDGLTGINGSFAQAFSGLRSALAIKDLIISIDIVLNKENIRYLYEILLFYINLGVYEFDLLNIVPFGRAWDNWTKLWYDPRKYHTILKKALALSKDKRLHIWTNRFPAEYLEGYEKMIQSPVKLLDEINGRREMFTDFILKNIELGCFGERCRYCFIKGMCSSLRELRDKKILKAYPLAPCLNGKKTDPVLNLKDIANAGNVDLDKFANFYIQNLYNIKKATCSARCSKNNSCKGVSVDRIKKDGFYILKPQ